MKFHDRLYGDIVIDEPVIVDLVKSKAVTRMKGVSQGGYEEPFFPGTWHSRFEHGVGDYELVTRNGASVAERIHALIHDVSHTAFSHCGDYLNGTTECQSHQDNGHEAYVKTTDIPRILSVHRLCVVEILDESRYPLAERELPDLCGDRIDYGMRAALVYKEAHDADVQRWLRSLKVRGKEWAFDSPLAAEEFASTFMVLNSKYYANFKSSVMGYSVGKYLRRALNLGHIAKEDLYTTDDEVLAKIEPHREGDAELMKHFRRMNNQVPATNDPSHAECVVRCKSRVVDPLCIVDGTLKRLTELVPDYKVAFDRERVPKVHHLRFQDTEPVRKTPAA